MNPRDAIAGYRSTEIRRAPAGLRKRLHAFVYDGMILAILLVIPIGIGAALRRMFGPPRWSPRGEDAFAFLVLILPVILYFTWAESSPRQATFGKRRAGLVVVSVTGARLSFRRALLRSALKFLPWQITLSFGQRRTPYDREAGAVVLSAKRME